MQKKTIKSLTKKHLVISSVILLAVICSVSLTVTALSKKSDADLNSNENLTQNEALHLTKELQKKSLNELISEVNNFDSSTDEQKILSYYDVIKEKLHKSTKRNITKELLNNNNTDDVKINLLTLCDSEEIALDYEKLLPILDDDSASSSVKSVLIDLLASEGLEFVDKIEEEVLAGKDSTIMQALLSLHYLKPERAEAIANDILSDLTNNFSENYKAALVTKAKALYLNPKQEEIEGFIKTCDSILNKMNAEDEDEKNISIFYALSLIQNKETFSYLMSIETEQAENFRAYIVEENQEIINNIFNETPSDESIELLVAASPYYVPQADYREKAKTYIEKNEDYFELNKAQKIMLLEVIE